MPKKTFPWLCFAPLLLVGATTAFGSLSFRLKFSHEPVPLALWEPKFDHYSPEVESEIHRTAESFILEASHGTTETLLTHYHPEALRDQIGWPSRLAALQTFLDYTHAHPHLKVQRITPFDERHAAVSLFPRSGLAYTLLISRKRGQPWAIINVRKDIPPSS